MQNCALLVFSVGSLRSVLLMPCFQAVDLLQQPQEISVDSNCTYCWLHLHKELAKEPMSSSFFFPTRQKYAFCTRKITSYKYVIAPPGGFWLMLQQKQLLSGFQFKVLIHAKANNTQSYLLSLKMPYKSMLTLSHKHRL